MAPTPPPAASTRPSDSTTAVVVPRMVARLGISDHVPTGGNAVVVSSLPDPPDNSTAARTPSTARPARLRTSGSRDDRRGATEEVAGAAHCSHLSPTSVRTMHFGQMGRSQSTQVSRVGSSCRSHRRV